MKRRSLSVYFWMRFVFAAVLCYVAVKLPDAAGPAFFSFLPLTFLFIAFAFGRLYAELPSQRGLTMCSSRPP